MHIGIPITNKKPGMVYNEDAKFWCSNPDDYDYKIEYLAFEDGTPFPEEIYREMHAAFKVISSKVHRRCGPHDLRADAGGDNAEIAFVRKDGAIIELYHEI